jgi:hypothetical protein
MSDERESDLDIKLPRTIAVGKLLKWIAAVVTVLGLAGVLVGYGIWIGSTNTTITTLKDDVKDIKDKDTKSANSLNKLVASLDNRFHAFELTLVKQQSAIEALQAEIRIRHEDTDYISQIVQHQDSSAQLLKMSRAKRQRVHESTLREASQRAALASDSAIGSLAEAVPKLQPAKLEKQYSF